MEPGAGSGSSLRAVGVSERYADYDAEQRFDVGSVRTIESPVSQRRGPAGTHQAESAPCVRDELHAAGGVAINGTVNDLAMSGAVALFLSCAFILEEGIELDALGRIAEMMGAAARRADVTLVAGDSKVVEKGHGDGVFINTTGIGLVPDGVEIGPRNARPGDVVIVSGPIGEHGVAIMSVREGLELMADPAFSELAAEVSAKPRSAIAALG